MREGVIDIEFHLVDASYQLALLRREDTYSRALYMYWTDYSLSFLQNFSLPKPISKHFGLLQFVDHIIN